MENLETVISLSRDVAKAARTLGRNEARFLVDAYYMMQDNRKRAGNQARALTQSAEPHAVIDWLFDQNQTMEAQIKRALTKYAETHPVGRRIMTVKGVGPVITAGLLAHIDIRKAPTAGHIWRFAGMDAKTQWHSSDHVAKLIKQGDEGETPEQIAHRVAPLIGRKPENIIATAAKRGEGEASKETVLWALKCRPWNANLKTLCWKIGESFVKQKSRGATYGLVYEQRKAYEAKINDEGGYSEQAQQILKDRPNHAQKTIYAEGRLPDGHIHSRAKRYAVKLFLAHVHEVWYRDEYGEAPPLPYPVAHLGHAHVIGPDF